MKKIVYHILEEDAGERIDKFIMRNIKEKVSRTFIQKVIHEKGVLVNDREVASNYKVRVDEEITVLLPEIVPWKLRAEKIPLDIVYEDPDVIVVNKAAFMVVHPAGGHREHTLVHALLAHAEHLSKSEDGIRPGIVHRLDKETSGLLIVAKTDFAHMKLSDDLKNKKVKKTYFALVYGVPVKKHGTIHASLTRSRRDRKKMVVAKEGKEGVTHYDVEKIWEKYALLKIQTETGRTHQIRVHLGHIGHSVVGDKLYRLRKWGPYYKEGDALIKRQALHASELVFHHPRSGREIRLSAPMPDDMKQAIADLGPNSV